MREARVALASRAVKQGLCRGFGPVDPSGEEFCRLPSPAGWTAIFTAKRRSRYW